jgi:hypothetical protein
MPEMKPKRLLYKRATAAHLLDESISTIIRMEEDGRLTPIVLRRNGIVHYRAEQVEALAQPQPRIERKQAPQPKPKKIARKMLARA